MMDHDHSQHQMLPVVSDDHSGHDHGSHGDHGSHNPGGHDHHSMMMMVVS